MREARSARYAVVRIDNGIGNPHTGIVSNHQTAEKAQEAIDRANRRLRRSAGQSRSWHPYAIFDRETGVKVYSSFDRNGRQIWVTVPENETNALNGQPLSIENWKR